MATTRRTGSGRPDQAARADDPREERAEHEQVMHEAAEVAAVEAKETGGLGKPGKPLDRRSRSLSE